MTRSENYNFNLPSSDTADIADINKISENFEIVDEKMLSPESDMEWQFIGGDIDIDIVIAEIVSQAKLAAHPIGSYYESDDPTDPSVLFGGTWERVKDCVTIARGDIFDDDDIEVIKVTIDGTETEDYNIIDKTLRLTTLPSENQKVIIYTNLPDGHCDYVANGSTRDFEIRSTGGGVEHIHSLNNAFAKGTVNLSNNNVYAKTKSVSGYDIDKSLAGTASSGSVLSGITTAMELGGNADVTNHLPPYQLTYKWRRIEDEE